jgi:5-methylcytosine-specific restriction protein A
VPSAAPKPCRATGCPEYGKPDWCPAHADKAVGWMRTKRLGPSLYDADWRKVRSIKLAAAPLCEMRIKCPTLPIHRQRSTEVHHVLPVAERPDLRLVWDNLRSICETCHKAITAAARNGERTPAPAARKYEAAVIG